MEDVLLLDIVERYLRGELNTDEKAQFEQLRKSTPAVDQLVVEHSMFLQQLNAYGQTRSMKHQLHDVHNKLLVSGEIKETIEQPAKVILLWRKYKRVTGIAASIACITALVISGLVSYFTPAKHENDLRNLSRQMSQIEQRLNVQGKQLNDFNKSKVPENLKPANAGTSFLIDGKGYLLTNAHVVQGASTIFVVNTKGQEFKARMAYVDETKDLAFLKIDDDDFKPVASLPYSIKKSNVDLGEQIFTLGFPRDEIVYNEGYLSAKTGHNGDTISCQIAVSANPGNSGGPILNKSGEVIGILSTAQQNAEGVVFAVKSKNIYAALDDMKKSDTSYARIKTPTVSTVKGMERVQQIKKIEDCVFMVKTFTK